MKVRHTHNYAKYCVRQGEMLTGKREKKKTWVISEFQIAPKLLSPLCGRWSWRLSEFRLMLVALLCSLLDCYVVLLVSLDSCLRNILLVTGNGGSRLSKVIQPI